MSTLSQNPTLVALAKQYPTPETVAREKRVALAAQTRTRAEYHAWLFADYAGWVDEGRKIRARYRWAASKQRQRATHKADQQTLAALGYTAAVGL